MFLRKALVLSCVAVFATGFASTSSNQPSTEAGKATPHCNFFPKNNLRYPDVHSSTAMNEAEFNSILDVVQKTYTPIFANYGFGMFQIERRWEDPTVNAYADIKDGQDSNGKTVPVHFIHMFGGLARHPDMTPEGFLLVACHEIGHHLGGYPKFEDQDWASVEGEADYYSTTKCARFVMGQMPDNILKATRDLKMHFGLKQTPVDPLVAKQCTMSFPNANQTAMCIRSSVAGLALGRTLGSLEGNEDVQFGTPDTSVVPQTNPDHPKAQCRLDTYFQGALCQKSENERMGSGPGQGACEAPERGARPACWYHSTASIVGRR